MKEVHYIDDTDLMYSVNYFYAGIKEEVIDDTKTVVGDGPEKFEETLFGTITSHKQLLLSEFKLIDTDKTGFVTLENWVDVMQRVCMIHLYWKSMFSLIVPRDCIHYEDEEETNVSVEYESFLQSFVTPVVSKTNSARSSVDNEAIVISSATSSSTSNTSNTTNTTTEPSPLTTEMVHLNNEELHKVKKFEEDDRTDLLEPITNSEDDDLIRMSIKELETATALSTSISTSVSRESQKLSLDQLPAAEKPPTLETDISRARLNSGADLNEYIRYSGDDASEIEDETAVDPVAVSGAVVEALYSHHRLLEAVFRFFDKSGEGTILRREFEAGVSEIIELLILCRKLLNYMCP